MSDNIVRTHQHQGSNGWISLNSEKNSVSQSSRKHTKICSCLNCCCVEDEHTGGFACSDSYLTCTLTVSLVTCLLYIVSCINCPSSWLFDSGGRDLRDVRICRAWTRLTDERILQVVQCFFSDLWPPAGVRQRRQNERAVCSWGGSLGAVPWWLLRPSQCSLIRPHTSCFPPDDNYRGHVAPYYSSFSLLLCPLLLLFPFCLSPLTLTAFTCTFLCCAYT